MDVRNIEQAIGIVIFFIFSPLPVIYIYLAAVTGDFLHEESGYCQPSILSMVEASWASRQKYRLDCDMWAFGFAFQTFNLKTLNFRHWCAPCKDGISQWVLIPPGNVRSSWNLSAVLLSDRFGHMTAANWGIHTKLL
jgi:hypothetical protein